MIRINNNILNFFLQSFGVGKSPDHIMGIQKVCHMDKNSSSVILKFFPNLTLPLPSKIPIFLLSFLTLPLGTSLATISFFLPKEIPISSPA